MKTIAFAIILMGATLAVGSILGEMDLTRLAYVNETMEQVLASLGG